MKGMAGSSEFPQAGPPLPVGTAVVALVEVRGSDGRVVHAVGATGLVVRAPADTEHSYRVRFPDGAEASLKRRDLRVLKHFQREGMEAGSEPEGWHGLAEHIIYRCVVGSRAYGLDHDESDTDRRGVYLPPAELHWSIYGVPPQLENTETEECYWELEKFLRLALKANPNVLEALYTPLVEHATPLAREMLAMRGVFLSKLIYQTFNGYAMSQFRKLEQDVRNQGKVKWKHAMHLVRLLRSGITALRTGEVPVRVEEGHQELLAIRDGRMPWKEVDELRLVLHAEFERAYLETELPERPDYEAVNAFLVRARREMTARGAEGGRVSVSAARPPTTVIGEASVAGAERPGTAPDFELCRGIMERHAYPLLFATVSGAHLYGFPSPDSDYDLRGAHLLPAEEVVGLRPARETVESAAVEPWKGKEVEIDLVTHDAAKFFRLMLKKNGYVLEQLLSPLVVKTTPEHEELKALAAACITRHHAHHYLGFAQTQWGLFAKENPPRVKPLLYVYRVLLTGIHLMRTGMIEANLVNLHAQHGDELAMPYIPELIARKTTGVEKQTLEAADLAFHEAEYRRLVALLEQERDRTSLREEATALPAMNELLVRLRLS